MGPLCLTTNRCHGADAVHQHPLAPLPRASALSSARGRCPHAPTPTAVKPPPPPPLRPLLPVVLHPQVRDYRETHATHKHVYHPPAEPSKEVNKVVKAVEDSGMGQALPVLTRSVRQTPAVAAFLSAAVNGSLARGAPRT